MKTGRYGEELAATFLEDQGFKIVARNFRYGHAEIDLIARREKWMLFIEVKTRAGAAYGEPEDFVSPSQGRRIMYAAEEYIFKVDWQGHIRFDVISVTLGNPPQIVHFEDAIN
jgi:putative endonuclease